MQEPIRSTHEPDRDAALTRANQRISGLLTLAQAIALGLIALATVAAIAAEAAAMWTARAASLGDLLMLFLYVEILAMVKQYALGTRELPVRTPVIIAIVAVARYMILDVEGLQADWLLMGSLSILALSAALWVIDALRRDART